jgi:hypothetical protein
MVANSDCEQLWRDQRFFCHPERPKAVSKDLAPALFTGVMPAGASVPEESRREEMRREILRHGRALARPLRMRDWAS